MEYKELNEKRHSARGFKKDPVSKETLEKVLAAATRAVSSQNTQPWHFAVVSGEVIEKIRACNIEDLHAGKPFDYPGGDAKGGVYKDRARAIGKQLYGLMGIAREDKERRAWWGERGFRFFDAPAVILIYTLDDIPESYNRLNVGCVVQNICLAAADEGLGTCAEDQAVYYYRGIKENLQLPENAQLQLGIAIGYEDPDFAANEVKSEREPLENVTEWYGF